MASYSVTTRPIWPLCNPSLTLASNLKLNSNCDFDLQFQTATLNFKHHLKASNCEFELQLQTSISKFNFNFNHLTSSANFKQFQTSTSNFNTKLWIHTSTSIKLTPQTSISNFCFKLQLWASTSNYNLNFQMAKLGPRKPQLISIILLKIYKLFANRDELVNFSDSKIPLHS